MSSKFRPPRSRTLAFAQIAEFSQDADGNYTGFVIKTFTPSGDPAAGITVHYKVDGKSTPH